MPLSNGLPDKHADTALVIYPVQKSGLFVQAFQVAELVIGFSGAADFPDPPARVTALEAVICRGRTFNRPGT